MSQIKAEISLRTYVKLSFHKNVGLQWYQWIPDFYNIRFDHYGLENFKNVVFLVKLEAIIEAGRVKFAKNWYNNKKSCFDL